MAKHTLHIPNIPAVPVEDIDPAEWKWIKSNYPAEYAQAQQEIKEHEAAHPATSAATATDTKAPASTGAVKEA